MIGSLISIHALRCFVTGITLRIRFDDQCNEHLAKFYSSSLKLLMFFTPQEFEIMGQQKVIFQFAD